MQHPKYVNLLIETFWIRTKHISTPKAVTQVINSKTLEEMIIQRFGFLFGKPMPPTTTTTTQKPIGIPIVQNAPGSFNSDSNGSNALRLIFYFNYRWLPITLLKKIWIWMSLFRPHETELQQRQQFFCYRDGKNISFHNKTNTITWKLIRQY